MATLKPNALFNLAAQPAGQPVPASEEAAPLLLRTERATPHLRRRRHSHLHGQYAAHEPGDSPVVARAPTHRVTPASAAAIPGALDTLPIIYYYYTSRAINAILMFILFQTKSCRNTSVFKYLKGYFIAIGRITN